MNIDLDQILDKARVAVGAVAKKTDEVVEYSKMKYERVKLNTELLHLYQELGEATYRAMKGDDSAETMDSVSEEIDLLLIDLAALDDMIEEKQKVVTCPQCAEKIDRECTFCPRCGAKMKAQQEEPKAEPPQAESEDKCEDCDCQCSDCEE